ncbi:MULTISPECIES: hypothetical protein [Streptomyces]|uniref:hypothetical protein n=1 Tax=Streptomyces TaxID=1883 RepID=UPI0004CD37BC|nr:MULTISPECIES: hypothetical protein [Streptomyces]KOT47112.1 hypothetical protein ADK43_40250 [Streptomyces rimosus subsp. rimosus]
MLPDNAPRGCRTQREGAWVFKRRYRSEQEIPARLRDDASTSWYWCEENYGGIHVGHTHMGEREKFRMFEDLTADPTDLLIKPRGAGHAQAGRREDLKHPEGLKALGKALRVYSVRLGVALPTGR